MLRGERENTNLKHCSMTTFFNQYRAYELDITLSCNYITAIFSARNKLVIDRRCPSKMRSTPDVARNKLVSDCLECLRLQLRERRNFRTCSNRVPICHVPRRGLHKINIFFVFDNANIAQVNVFGGTFK